MKQKKSEKQVSRQDGPASPLFKTVSFDGNVSVDTIGKTRVSKEMRTAVKFLTSGKSVSYGMPFETNRVILAKTKSVEIKIKPLKAKWLVFLHTADVVKLQPNKHGFYSPARGGEILNNHIADYVIRYSDGSEASIPVRSRHEIASVSVDWGNACVSAVPENKPKTPYADGNCRIDYGTWGRFQTHIIPASANDWGNWVWPCENPNPEKEITGVRIEPKGKMTVVVSAITAGHVDENPVRWNSRKKAVLTLPKGLAFDTRGDMFFGTAPDIRIDLGQVISVTPQLVYPKDDWEKTYNNKRPLVSRRKVVVEYTSHPDARFYVGSGKSFSVALAETAGVGKTEVRTVSSSDKEVKVTVLDKTTGKAVPVKLHIHGEAGEYLPPVDRHRYSNPYWYEDYSVDFLPGGIHFCSYVPGETKVLLPEGRVYVEVSKGFEIRPVRKIFNITKATEEIRIELEKVLPWREKGWVTADTHVHFLSPQSALLEGSAEGVNVVNLLASQWGELMTNVGDFDGKTTVGSKSAGGDGEYLVRVGTENRQGVLGHISLLGYNGKIIAPMTTGGPGESALGDPVGCLLTEWAEQCRKQDGVVVLPHFPNPRLENAVGIIKGLVDGVEMTAWNELYYGINPYSLSDWYRYLNCGYMTAAVAGTDKMAATTAVGTIRTYAKLDDNQEFNYDAWKSAIRKAHTFVTYGPLMEFSVEGKPAGSRIKMNRTGGTVDVEWELASVTIPMTKVELIVNGEIRASRAVNPDSDRGHFSVKIDRSSWVALLVRGKYKDKKHEMITSHSSPVMIEVEGTHFYSAIDALTILEQIEGTLAYIDTIGTKAENERYKKMRLILTSSHRELHNRMHAMGRYHNHTATEEHHR